jgi:hypothetical protein
MLKPYHYYMSRNLDTEPTQLVALAPHTHCKRDKVFVCKTRTAERFHSAITMAKYPRCYSFLPPYLEWRKWNKFLHGRSYPRKTGVVFKVEVEELETDFRAALT